MNFKLHTLKNAKWNNPPYIPPTIELDGVLKDIQDERERQDKKWGAQNYAPTVWTTILAEEFGEASKEACDAFLKERNLLNQSCDRVKTHKELKEIHKKLRVELIQTAAVAVAFIQSLDRNELK